MVGITSIAVKENLAELASQLRQAKTSKEKEQLQVLYWLKQENAHKTANNERHSKKPDDDLSLLSQYERQRYPEGRKIRYFVQDESRFGLKTLVGRLITACGIKPIGQ